MNNSRVALVTGASRGLGYAVAHRLGAQGYHVIALSRTIGGLEELADEIEKSGGPTPTLVPLSITDDGGFQRMCLAIHQRWGHVDLVVHCAAHAPPQSPVPHVADKDFNQTLDVNLKGTQRVIAMLAPLLREGTDGCFVHVTDDRAGEAFFGTYAASKCAAETLVQAWARECRNTGPRVTTFRPEAMPTALRARFFPGEDAAVHSSCDDQAARLISELKIG